MKTIKLITLFVTLSFLLGRTAIAMPMSMEKDIAIMENILDKMIVEDSPIFFSYGDRFQGEYYDDYGIVLTVESAGFFNLGEQLELRIPELPPIPIIDEDGRIQLSDQEEEDRKRIKEQQQKLEQKKQDTQAEIDKKLEMVKEILLEFFFNYTRGTLEMKESEKIMVNLKVDRSRHLDRKYNIPAVIQMTATVADLKRFYRGKMDESKLEQKLIFNAPTSDNQKKDIEVMTNIFDTFLEKKSEFWNKRNKSTGFYLEGFGAVFNVPIAGNTEFFPFQVNTKVIQKKMENVQQELEKAQKKLENFKVKADKEQEKDNKTSVHKYKYKTDKDSHIVASSDDNENIDINVQVESDLEGDIETDIISFSGSEFSATELDSIMDKTQEDIIKTLSIYGATLKSVQPDEKISVKINLNNTSAKQERNLSCKKQDVLDYTAGKIDYSEFAQRFVVK